MLDLILISCLECIHVGRVGRSSVTEKLDPKDVTCVMDGSIRIMSFRVDQKVRGEDQAGSFLATLCNL